MRVKIDEQDLFRSSLDCETNCGSFFSVDLHVDKFRDAHDVVRARFEVRASDRNCLHGLIRSSGAYGLKFGGFTFAQHAGERAGDRVWVALRGDFEDVRSGCAGWGWWAGTFIHAIPRRKMRLISRALPFVRSIATTAAQNCFKPPFSTLNRSENAVVKRSMTPAASIPITPSVGPVIPTSLR